MILAYLDGVFTIVNIGKCDLAYNLKGFVLVRNPLKSGVINAASSGQNCTRFKDAHGSPRAIAKITNSCEVER